MKKISKKEKELEGIYRAASHSFGFVKLDNSNDEEIYIAAKDSLNAMNDDRVLVKIDPKSYITDKKNREGKIVKIIEKATDIVVGIFEPSKGYGFVNPINNKIQFDVHIDKRFFGKAVKDSIVVAKLLNTKAKGDNPEGVIIDVIGHKDDPNAEITAIVKDFKIKDVFEEETLKEADRVAEPINKEDFEGRVDLRDKNFITIDGEDTKDIDDAIFLEDTGKGTKKLYVSIADVSHYVKEGKALDKEALIRGNSVYLLDRVIPMIPHVLSNGMCSLNEDVDRLTLTCEMEYDGNGKVINHDIYKSIIHSHKRTTYTEVQKVLEGKENELNPEINKMLLSMIELSRILRKLRDERGAISFNVSETYIEVDENLKPISINEKKRIEANDLIEDFMVAANETVAYEFYKREIPFLYRTHESCDDEKIKDLTNTLISLGVPFTYKENIEPKDIQKLLNDVKDKPYQFVVDKLTLRSMAQAKYTKKALGHFALASKYYTHFTSPIRRYNDLQIHRIIKEVLEGRYDKKRREHYDGILDSVAFRISKTERQAIDCERDINSLKECEFMKDKIGEEFEGVVSGLTNFGIFVELPNTIEGMIALRDMTDDRYVFNESKYEVRGEKTGKKFTFGQKVKVLLLRVKPEIRAIDFEWVQN